MENDIRQSRQALLQKSCFSELHQSTIRLCNLCDSLPAVISVRPDFVNGGYERGVENYHSFHFDSNQEDKSFEESK